MPFKPGISGNPNGRPKKKDKVMSVFERALPRIERELETASPEVCRELVLGLAGIIKHQSLNK